MKYSTKYKVMTVKNEVELPLHLHPSLVSACLCAYIHTYVWRVQGLPATDFVIDIIYYQHVLVETLRTVFLSTCGNLHLITLV